MPLAKTVALPKQPLKHYRETLSKQWFRETFPSATNLLIKQGQGSPECSLETTG